MRIIITFLLNAGLNFAVGLAVAAALGPTGYGRFAVGASAGAVIATGLFDWLRLSTARFYGEAQRVSRPALRCTLDITYVVLAAVLVGAGVLLLGLRVDFGMSIGLTAAVVLTAVANGMFDFQAALARARFRDRAYAVLVIGKGTLGLAFAVGAALTIADPAITLAAQAFGTLLATLPVRAQLSDRSLPDKRIDVGLLRRFVAYGMPVVAANVIFQGILLMNRAAAAAAFGYAAAGHLSLATDIVLRLMLATGAALDVLVFQIAVRREALEGRHAAERQLQTNMTIVAAVLVLLGLGFVVTAPAFAALLVPARFRDDFVPLALTVLPGIFLFCLGQFAINPVFQIAHRTAPIVGAAVASAAIDVTGLLLLPDGFGPVAIATVHSLSLGMGFLILSALAMRDKGIRPSLKDGLGVGLAGGVMTMALWPTREIPLPALSLLAAGLVGPLVFMTVLLILDVGRCRALIREMSARVLRRWRIEEMA